MCLEAGLGRGGSYTKVGWGSLGVASGSLGGSHTVVSYPVVPEESFLGERKCGVPGYENGLMRFVGG